MSLLSDLLSWLGISGQSTMQAVLTPVSPQPGTIGAVIARTQTNASPTTTSTSTPTSTAVSSQAVAPTQTPYTPTYLQSSQLSNSSKGFYAGATKVSDIIGGWMGIADVGAQRIQSQLPPSIGAIYGAAYSIGRGIVFTGTQGIVQTAGMIPGGIETIAQNRAMMPTFIATGLTMQATGMIEGIKERPFQTIGELAVMTSVGSSGKIIRRGEVSIPTATGTSIPVWKGLYLDIGSKPTPLIGYVPEIVTAARIPTEIAIGFNPNIARFISTSVESIKTARTTKPIFGMPSASEVPFVSDIAPGYFPHSVIETAIITKPKTLSKLGIEPTSSQKISVGTELIKLTEHQGTAFQLTRPYTINLLGKEIVTPFTVKTLITETATLPQTGVKATLDYLKSGIIPKSQTPVGPQIEKVMGSFSAQSQMMPKYRRIAGDIDVHTTGTKAEAFELAKGLQVKLKEIDIETRISGTTVETRGTTKDWVHAVQFLPKEIKSYVGAEGAGLRYGIKVDQPPMKVEGQSIMRLSEQTIRKITGSLEFHEGKLQPPKHRFHKDVVDAFTTASTLIESKATKPGIPILKELQVARGRELLQQWKELYPEIDWTKVVKEPIKMEIPLEGIGKGKTTKTPTTTLIDEIGTYAKRFESIKSSSIVGAEALKTSYPTSETSSRGQVSIIPSYPEDAFYPSDSSYLPTISKTISPSLSPPPTKKSKAYTPAHTLTEDYKFSPYKVPEYSSKAPPYFTDIPYIPTHIPRTPTSPDPVYPIEPYIPYIPPYTPKNPQKYVPEYVPGYTPPYTPPYTPLIKPKFIEKLEKKKRIVRRKSSAYYIKNQLSDLEDILGIVESSYKHNQNHQKNKRSK